MPPSRFISLICIVAPAAAFIASASPAQTPAAFGTCIPRDKRGADSVGCFIVTEKSVSGVGARPFWHVDRFDTPAQARAARSSNSTFLEAFHAVWLLTIADSTWRPNGGTHMATIGPLPTQAGVSYSALYMEASMRPGMKSMIHFHSGAEAWYTMSGETCLETPRGATIGRAGGPPVIVPGDTPMELTATGTTLRRSLVLILHDASRAPTSMEMKWKPKGTCSGRKTN